MISVYQTDSTIIWTLTVGQGILRVINGTFYAPQHKDDPPAEQKPVKGVPRADKPGHIPPLGGIVPHLGVQQAAADYQKFMTTKTYTDYTKAYEVFLKKNPGYEDKIASKLNG